MIKKLRVKLKEKGFSGFNNRTLQKIWKVLGENEEVMAICRGTSDHRRCLLVATSRRLIVYDAHFLSGCIRTELSLDSMTSLKIYTGEISGKISIGSFSSEILFEDSSKEQATLFVKELRKILHSNVSKVLITHDPNGVNLTMVRAPFEPDILGVAADDVSPVPIDEAPYGKSPADRANELWERAIEEDRRGGTDHVERLKKSYGFYHGLLMSLVVLAGIFLLSAFLKQDKFAYSILLSFFVIFFWSAIYGLLVFRMAREFIGKWHYANKALMKDYKEFRTEKWEAFLERRKFENPYKTKISYVIVGIVSVISLLFSFTASVP